MARLNRDARQIAEPFGLRFRVVEAERAGVKRRWGACFDDGTIKIRLVKVGSGDLLKYSSLVDTLCHELAHLKYWHHGPGFQAFYKRLLAYARREGIYEPRRRRVQQPPARVAASTVEPAPTVTRRRQRTPTGTRPEQLSLFSPKGP